MSSIIKEVASKMYPDNFVECQSGSGFRIDVNASCRSVAEDVLAPVISILRSESAAKNVVLAFYRREHGSEPDESELPLLTAKMSVSLMALDGLLLSVGEVNWHE